MISMWLRGGHLQTIVPALVGRHFTLGPQWIRERVETPDGDFLDWDWLTPSADPGAHPPSDRPLWVLFHGLEGSSASHYAKALGRQAQSNGFELVVVHFRGCSGEVNRLPRAYHSGDHEEIDWVLRLIRSRHPERAVYAVGVSLGGNALLLWAALQGKKAASQVDAVMAVSAPLDLTKSGHALERGLSRYLYTPMFLQTMKGKAKQKWNQFPGLFDLESALKANTLWGFDDAFTAPVHGYGSVERYWVEASALPHLTAIRVPTCILNARNDPFVPVGCLPEPHQVSASVTLVQPEQGGHVGFWTLQDGQPADADVDRNRYLPQFLFDWIKQHGRTNTPRHTANG